MFAVWPTLTVTGCAAGASWTDHRCLADLQGVAAGKARPAGVREEPTGMGAGSRGVGGARGRWAGQVWSRFVYSGQRPYLR